MTRDGHAEQGVGINSDCPFSSIITSKFAMARWRGENYKRRLRNAKFWPTRRYHRMLFLTPGFKSSLEFSTKLSNCSDGCAEAVDKMWRTLIGFGAVPGCIALYYRLAIPETPRYTFDAIMDVE